jgi:hypothetical protein
LETTFNTVITTLKTTIEEIKTDKNKNVISEELKPDEGKPILLNLKAKVDTILKVLIDKFGKKSNLKFR